MNPMRLVLAIVVVFVALFGTDLVIHGGWLKSTYKETMHLWRTEAEMQSHMVWLTLGQFVWSVAFVVIWWKGIPAVASLGRSCLYGLVMGLFSQVNSLIMYAVQPLPGSLIGKWIFAGVVQGILMGAIVYLVGRPRSTAPVVQPAAVGAEC